MEKIASQNIFNYATSELSQDAFISLMVAWFYNEDEKLKEISKDFINALYKVYFNKNNTLIISSVKLIQQHHKIDVYFEVTDEHQNIIRFIIEDKTWTEPHSDQLSRYVRKVSKLKTYPTEENKETKNIVKIFFKTGHITEKDRAETKKAKYIILDTKWMYKFLTKYNKLDNIFFESYKEFFIEKFYKKLYNNNGLEKRLKDWNYRNLEEGYVQYAVIESIKYLMQINKVYTNNYIKYTKNGKRWDTWWSFYEEIDSFSMFVKIKKIGNMYRLRLIRYAAKKQHTFNGEEFNKCLKILNTNEYRNIQKTTKPRFKARESEIAFLEFSEKESLEKSVKYFSNFLIKFVEELKINIDTNHK